MLRKRVFKCVTVYLVTALLLAFHLTQTESSILRKTQRPGRKEASGIIREGIIVFGKGPKNASLDNDGAYQADFAGFHSGKPLDLKEAQWKRMFPSLQCGSDQMKFRAVGSPVKFFALDKQPPLPLSHVPSTCGYNMQRNPFGLVMNVPYHGCHVYQEGGNYNLPLLWNGIPVSLKCPKPQDGSASSSPQVPALPQVPTGFPYYHHLWNPLLQGPTTTTTTAPPQYDPAQWNAYLSYLQQLQTNQGQSTTTTTAPPQDPALWTAYLSYLQQLHTNQGQSNTAPQDPVPQVHHYPPHYMFPYYIHHYNQLHYKPKEPATTSAPNVPQNPQGSLFGSFYKHPWMYGQQTAAATLTDQFNPGPFPFDPYLYSQYMGQASEGAPATTSAPSGYSWYSQSMNMPWWLQGKFPTAELTNAASPKPQYGQVPVWKYNVLDQT
ncbi:uncharacterized protein [Eucyclogobius newberryi]|uniref:uncharacterized protein n=1 Tax=Eucyclogobius newberryi TaxID=166745 RepID=UPI003B5B9B71